MDEFTIRPLVWELYAADYPDSIIARYGFGSYTISPHKDGGYLVYFIDGHIVKRPNIEQAKAACQADYEKQLLECLEPVVKVDCGDCVHFEPKNPHDMTPDLCLKYSLYTRAAVRSDLCDNGRNGEPKGGAYCTTCEDEDIKTIATCVSDNDFPLCKICDTAARER